MTSKQLTARYLAAHAHDKALLEGRPMPIKARKAPRARVMFAVISDGRDLGAYKTRELAQAAADLLPDAYVSECMRAPVKA